MFPVLLAGRILQGAVGIAGLHLILRESHLRWLDTDIAHSTLPQMTAGQALRFKDHGRGEQRAPAQLLRRGLERYLRPARNASENGYSVAFLTVAAACLAGCS